MDLAVCLSAFPESETRGNLWLMRRRNGWGGPTIPCGVLLALSACGGNAPSEGPTDGTGGAGTENGGSANTGGSLGGGDSNGGNSSGGENSGSGSNPSSGGSSDSGGSGGADLSGGANGTGGANDDNRHVIPDGPVTIDGRTLIADGTAIQLRGVCWNPVPLGGNHPADLDFSGFAEIDIPLMEAAGINVVRTYEPISDTAVLDALHAAGIKVLMTVYAYGGNEPSSAVTIVNAVKDHPAVLLWLVGNEWNYNGHYVGLSLEDSRALVQEAAELVKQADPDHLVGTVYGELPSSETIAALPAIDVWGINSYRGISFGDLFESWESLSTLPMFLAEYGADAYDARDGGAENLEAQAEATAALALELETNAARTGGVVSGGTIFEWADEWWKDEDGDDSVQDVGGIAPGGGPHPDATFNEEWWGIVTIERTPRPAYDELKTIFLSP